LESARAMAEVLILVAESNKDICRYVGVWRAPEPWLRS